MFYRFYLLIKLFCPLYYCTRNISIMNSMVVVVVVVRRCIFNCIVRGFGSVDGIGVSRRWLNMIIGLMISQRILRIYPYGSYLTIR